MFAFSSPAKTKLKFLIGIAVGVACLWFNTFLTNKEWIHLHQQAAKLSVKESITNLNKTEPATKHHRDDTTDNTRDFVEPAVKLKVKELIAGLIKTEPATKHEQNETANNTRDFIEPAAALKVKESIASLIKTEPTAKHQRKETTNNTRDFIEPSAKLKVKESIAGLMKTAPATKNVKNETANNTRDFIEPAATLKVKESIAGLIKTEPAMKHQRKETPNNTRDFIEPTTTSQLQKCVKENNKTFTTQDVDMLVESIQYERKNHLKFVCQQHKKRSESRCDVQNTYVNLRSMYSQKYKFSSCYIMKIGFSNWLRALLVTEGYYTAEKVYDMKTSKAKWLDILMDKLIFRSMKNERNENWKQSFKIMTVRSPFSRLVSAYNDKMIPTSEGFTYYYGPMSRKINRRFKSQRHDINERNKANDTTASFEDFVNYLLSKKGNGLDGHWDFYYHLCEPCSANYDFIVKFDTLHQDMDYLKRKLNISAEHAKGFFPHANFVTNSDMVEEYFKQIPKDKTRQLYELYRKDFDLFGYEAPPWLCL